MAENQKIFADFLYHYLYISLSLKNIQKQDFDCAQFCRIQNQLKSNTKTIFWKKVCFILMYLAIVWLPRLELICHYESNDIFLCFPGRNRPRGFTPDRGIRVVNLRGISSVKTEIRRFITTVKKIPAMLNWSILGMFAGSSARYDLFSNR